MTQVRATTCNRDCPDACRIVATVQDGQVIALAGDPQHPITQGFLCHRTANFLTRQSGTVRLTQPLLRQPDGQFAAIGWEQALDLAAQKLGEIRDSSGGAAILHYHSGGSLGMIGQVIDLFFAHLGPVTVKRGDICSGAGDAAQMADFGVEDSNDVTDLLNSKHILLWGKNPAVSGPHLLPVLKRARQGGTRVTLIDPVFHKTAHLCDSYLQPRPGGDFALAMAVAQGLLAERRDLAAELCDNLEAFSALCQSRSLAQWCTDADVTIEQAIELTRQLLDGPCAILVGWGMGRRVNGSGIVRALDALSAISGNLRVAGGGVSFYFKRRAAFVTDLAGPGPAPRTLSEPCLGQEILDARDPPIRAVWVTAGNPVAMLPQARVVQQALASREFVVVVDNWLSDTAKLAQLVLPTTTLLEANDIVGAYGHGWLGVARPVVEPPAGVRSDLQIIQALAARLGLTEVVAGSARQWQERLLHPQVRAAGVTLADLEAGPVRNPLVPKVLFAEIALQTPTAKVQLLTTLPPPTPKDPEYPLQLLSLSTEKSQSSQWVHPPTGPATVTVHPQAVPGLAEGQLVRVESEIDSLVAILHLDPRQRRDLALLPKGGQLSDGRCANALIRAQLTDAGEGAAYYDQGVRIRPT